MYSERLFGRHQALAIYATIAQMPKSDFTTGELVKLAGAPRDACSKELSRLASLSLVTKTSRTGDYQRNDKTRFWELIEALAIEWGDAEDRSLSSGQEQGAGEQSD